MADDHDEGHHADHGEYDPSDSTVPERTPPLRSTAPQSPYTSGQVGVGAVVAVVGLLVVFGIPLVL